MFDNGIYWGKDRTITIKNKASRPGSLSLSIAASKSVSYAGEAPERHMVMEKRCLIFRSRQELVVAMEIANWSLDLKIERLFSPPHDFPGPRLVMEGVGRSDFG